MKNRNLLLLCLSAIALSACASFEKKPVTDCSTIFENINTSNPKPAVGSLEGNEQESKQCQVLKIKIQKDVTCEVAGSDSTEKLVELYQNDNDDERITLIAPIKSMDASDIIANYDTIYNYYKVLNNIEDHVSSDLFKSLEDFKYKGIKCEANGQKFVGWIGNDQFIASYKGKTTVSKTDNAEGVKADNAKSHKTKPTATKKAGGKVKVKTEQKNNQ